MSIVFAKKYEIFIQQKRLFKNTRFLNSLRFFLVVSCLTATASYKSNDEDNG